MKNTMKMVCLFSLLLLLLTGCDSNRVSRPVARYQEEVTATITQINKGSWFAGTRHYEVRVRVVDNKYGVSAYFQTYAQGMFYLPKYWECEKGDQIAVIAHIEYFTDTNEIYRIWLSEASN